MKRKWKWILGIGGVLLVAGGVFASVKMSQRGIVTVQTGKVLRSDLTSLVTASGEIKPRDYYNIGANVMGRIVAINVKEGDHVKQGQVLARLENIQADADVQAQQASLNSALADSSAAESGLKAMEDNIQNAQATVDRAKADLDKARVDFQRGEEALEGQADRQAGLRRPQVDSRQPGRHSAWRPGGVSTDAGAARTDCGTVERRAEARCPVAGHAARASTTSWPSTWRPGPSTAS